MNNKNLRSFLAALSVGLVSLPAYVQSQAIFYNNGADIMVSAGGLVQINGGYYNAKIGNLTNDGEIHVDHSSTNGDFTNDQGFVDGSGDLFIEGDWYNNNGVFTADASNTSHVEFYGTNNQIISNSNPVSFWDLKTSGSGIKTMVLNDITVLNSVALTNVELATEDFTLWVENTSPAAVTNDKTYLSEGFVSSLTGFLAWDMDQTSDYVFPVGSSVGTKRYRAVTLKPTTASTSRFMVSMENVDATSDGYDVNLHDVSLCMVNDQFYHRIVRDAGSVSANIGIDFDPSKDGADWSASAQWQTEWEKTGVATIASGTYKTVTVAGYNNFSTDPFALAGITPESPEIAGASGLCAGDFEAGLYTGIGDPNSTLAWSVSGGSIVGDSVGSEINVDWSGTSTATVYLTQTNSIGCVSQPASMSVNVFPLPVAEFVGDSAPFSFTLYSFTDSSVGNNGVSSWAWDFGDGSTSSQQDPYHLYDGPGTYSVQLVVTNENGCVDTIEYDVTINEGLVISNTFTPNGDGINDYFMLPNSGITEYHIQILNRWGTMVYESDAPSVTWDGKTRAGLEVPPGTYFYIINAKAGDNDHSSQGYVELLRDRN
jgi:gliding motility-associated-like protein